MFLYPRFLRSAPPPTLERERERERERESSGPKTSGHTVSRQYLLIKKLNEKRKTKLAKISFSARGFARSLPDNTTSVLRTQRSLTCGFASFSPGKSIFATAFSRLLPSVSVTLRRAKKEKRIALFTLELLKFCPREIISQLLMTCASLIG